MKKIVKNAVIALISLVCVIICVKMFLWSGNGLWAIWAVLCGAVNIGAIADAIAYYASEEFLDWLWKGGKE